MLRGGSWLVMVAWMMTFSASPARAVGAGATPTPLALDAPTPAPTLIPVPAEALEANPVFLELKALNTSYAAAYGLYVAERRKPAPDLAVLLSQYRRYKRDAARYQVLLDGHPELLIQRGLPMVAPLAFGGGPAPTPTPTPTPGGITPVPTPTPFPTPGSGSGTYPIIWDSIVR